MFLHIVIDSYYSLEFAKLLREIDDQSSHVFVMMRGSGSSHQYSVLNELKQEVLVASPSHSQFYERFTDEWLRRFDKVFLHGMFHSSLIYTLLNKVEPSTFDRIYFIPYDGDVQLAIQYIENGSSNHPHVLALQKIKNWVIPPRYREIRSKFFKNFQSKLCNFYELHPMLPQPLQPHDPELFEIFVNHKLSRKSNPFRIMVGHSCSSNDNHILTLTKLAPLAQSDIQIILPMAYHLDVNYRHKVYEVALSVFGNKVCLWNDYLNPKQYAEKLKTINAAIFNLTKATGFGVLSYLIMCGCKVYTNQRQLEASELRHLRERGCTIFEYEDLINSPFSLLDPIEVSSALLNFHIISNSTYSKKLLVSNWQEII